MIRDANMKAKTLFQKSLQENLQGKEKKIWSVWRASLSCVSVTYPARRGDRPPTGLAAVAPVTSSSAPGLPVFRFQLQELLLILSLGTGIVFVCCV